MAQIILSVGAKKANLFNCNLIESKNFIEHSKNTAICISEYDRELYKDSESWKYLSYQLLSNFSKPLIVCVNKLTSSIPQCLKSSLQRFTKGLIILDLPNKKELCKEVFEIVEKNENPEVQILINIPNIQCYNEVLNEKHTGWKLLNKLNIKDFEYLKNLIGDLDATGLVVASALRNEYIKTYKAYCKKNKKPASEDINIIPFYYSQSQIIIDRKVFDELIDSTLKNLELFNLPYDKNDLVEMYL